MKRVVCWIAVAAALVITGCEKKDAPGASGALSAPELDLFRSVPGGNNLVFGGSYAKLQNFMQRTALGRMSRDAAESLGGKALADWMQCFADMKGLTIAGGARFMGGAELRMVMSGVGIAEISQCSTKSGFKTTPDADNKFVTIEIPGPNGPMTQGYLLVAPNTLYTRGTATFGGVGVSMMSGTRADLEGDLAGAKQKNVATDTALQSVIAKADRSKTVWFAGSAAGTLLGDKLGEVYGSIDIGSGFAFDVIVQFVDAELQRQIEDNIDQVKKMSDKAPSKEMKTLVDNLVAKRVGDRMRFALKVDDSQLEALMSMSGGMLGGGM